QPDDGERSSRNLPLYLTPFIGRRSEIEQIREIYDRTRLLTLSGPAGIGKTRLAVQIASEHAEYQHNVWFVDLTSIGNEELVPHTVAAALGLRDEVERSLTETITDRLRSQTALLVLDNCEHVIAGSARLVEKLLRGCPTVRVIATSREPLRIAGETVFRVP